MFTPSTLASPVRLLVAGGAGYISSHTLKYLLLRGCDVVTFDNLSTRHRDAVPGGAFELGELAESTAVHKGPNWLPDLFT
jgi:UDP-glucose 4-epimerase